MIPGEGFDHNYCINRGVNQDVTFATRLFHSLSGRVLEMYTNQPGVQFYTGKSLPEPTPTSIEAPADDTDESDNACRPGDLPCTKVIYIIFFCFGLKLKLFVFQMGFDCTDGQPCGGLQPNDGSVCHVGDIPCTKVCILNTIDAGPDLFMGNCTGKPILRAGQGYN